jgi:hypothetical protein
VSGWLSSPCSSFGTVRRVGEGLVDWWVDESRTGTGRRKWSSGVWGSDQMEDPDARKQAAASQGWAIAIVLATGSLILLLTAVSALVRG